MTQLFCLSPGSGWAMAGMRRGDSVLLREAISALVHGNPIR
jgi:hypothetical protein